VSKAAAPIDTRVRSTLIWYSLLGGFLITALAVVLRSMGIYRPVPYLTYPGSYLMQAFVERFLSWLPWGIGDSLVLELFAFVVLNVLGYALVIFLLLRIFIPNRSDDLPPITGGK